MRSVKRCIKKKAHLVIKGFYYEPLRWQGRLCLQEKINQDQDHVFDVHVADQDDEQWYDHDGSL